MIIFEFAQKYVKLVRLGGANGLAAQTERIELA